MCTHYGLCVHTLKGELAIKEIMAHASRRKTFLGQNLVFGPADLTQHKILCPKKFFVSVFGTLSKFVCCPNHGYQPFPFCPNSLGKRHFHIVLISADLNVQKLCYKSTRLQSKKPCNIEESYPVCPPIHCQLLPDIVQFFQL